MSGVSSTALGLVLVGLAAVLLFGAAWWFPLPFFVVAGVLVLVGPVLRFFVERGAPGTDEPGVPTTRQASYEPVEPRNPSEQ